MSNDPGPDLACRHEPGQSRAARLFPLLAVASILGGLLVGYEPVGGDPDRLYRPLKSELARALREGRLPFWSDRFGLGIPLVAESQVAALYPPNLVLYRLLGVNAAYRAAMFLHYMALAATTFAYARRLGLTPWGGALASVAFTFCGFQAIHSSHEPFYHILPYLPLALLLAECYLASGRLATLGLLALALGAPLLLGHFQIQMWTGGLVLVTGLWRLLEGRATRGRVVLLGMAVGWAGMIAAAQLALSWEFAGAVGQTGRRPELLAFYSFPPAHWAELALPRFFRGLRQGPEDPYWFGQQTTGYEAALTIGTVPLILSFAGLLDARRGRALNVWRLLVPLTFALATMPRWWPAGYFALLRLPGLGYFRCPARYTLLTSLGLALLAGRGLDRTLATRTLRAGLVLALLFGAAAVAWGIAWSTRPDFRSVGGSGGLPYGLLPGLVSWSVGLVAIVAWCSGRVGGWAPCLVAAVELGLLYHSSTTRWGWSVALPAESAVLEELLREPGVRRIGGVLEDIPVRAGLTAATPYLGFTLPPPLPVLERAATLWLDQPHDPSLRRWLRRYGVTHVVADRPVAAEGAGSGRLLRDPALDRLVYRAPGRPERRAWSIVRAGEPFPDARAAVRTRVVDGREGLFEALSRGDGLDQSLYLRDDVPAGFGPPGARVARVVRWDGVTATVEHDGPCDLVLTRAYDPGWRARVDDGPDLPVLRADGGIQAVRVPGAGTTRLSFRYRPRLLSAAAGVSVASAAAALLVVLAGAFRRPGAGGGDEMIANPIISA